MENFKQGKKVLHEDKSWADDIVQGAILNSNVGNKNEFSIAKLVNNKTFKTII